MFWFEYFSIRSISECARSLRRGRGPIHSVPSRHRIYFKTHHNKFRYLWWLLRAVRSLLQRFTFRTMSPSKFHRRSFLFSIFPKSRFVFVISSVLFFGLLKECFVYIIIDLILKKYYFCEFLLPGRGTRCEISNNLSTRLTRHHPVLGPARAPKAL